MNLITFVLLAIAAVCSRIVGDRLLGWILDRADESRARRKDTSLKEAYARRAAEEAKGDMAPSAQRADRLRSPPLD
jgi:hypothetical protein